MKYNMWLFLVILLANTATGIIHTLPFIELSGNAQHFTGVDDQYVTLLLPSALFFFNESFTTGYINSNGMIHFRSGGSQFSSTLFPIDDTVISPYWYDIDTRTRGQINYQSFTQGAVLDQVNDFLKNNRSISFTALSVAVIEWEAVCPYSDQNCQTSSPNTFQVVLTSSSEVSYAIFTYQCGSLNPNAYTPSIGYSFSSSFFENHFLSEQTNASEIACLNQPSSVWSNVVYKLNLVNELPLNFTCTPKCVNGNCTGPNTCTCERGWSGLRCRSDIDECANNVSLCNHYCNNTEGSFICSCDEGYSLSENNFTCIDINECLTENGECSHFCNNTEGSFYCSCPTGYQLMNQKSCIDINECALTDRGKCSDYCNNTIGGYFCSCRNGYRLKDDQKQCEDINECLIDVCNNETEECINTLGSFSCICANGYRRWNGYCEDINECLSSNGGCSHNCNNTRGSYFCSCPKGYLLQNERSCEDINECQSLQQPCDHSCTNTIGSFYCECQAGYSLINGSLCEAKPCFETLVSPLNGKLQCNSSLQVTYTECNVTCGSVLFELVGSETRICQTDSSWSGEASYCMMKRCPPLVNPNNGYVLLPCSQDVNYTCQARCYEGYKLVNGSQSATCTLYDDSVAMWSEIGECSRKPLCTDTTCLHGGRCIIISKDEFECDCTGTMYQGRICEQGLVVVSEIDDLFQFENATFFMSARPDSRLTVHLDTLCEKNSIQAHPCSIVFDSQHTEQEIIVLSNDAGLFEIPMRLEGENYMDFTQPSPLQLLVLGKNETSTYFATDNDYELQQGCCSISNLYLQCASERQFRKEYLFFTSSCIWMDEYATSGIVFFTNGRINLPISVSGLHFTRNLPPKLPTNINKCDGCSRGGKVCDTRQPSVTDVKELILRQSLERTFISELNKAGFPPWLQFTVPTSSSTGTNFAFKESDVRVYIVTENDLAVSSVCRQMITDSTGYFALLQHNGALQATLMSNNQFERVNLTVPDEGMYYCFAVNLCISSSSQLMSVHMSLPSSSVQSLYKLRMFSEYLDKGWSLEILSFIFRKVNSAASQLSTSSNYWNGYTSEYHPLAPSPNVHMNSEFSGNFNSEETGVLVSFKGSVSYQYVDSDNKESKSIAYGGHEVTVNLRLHNKTESLLLDKSLSSAFIYFNRTQIHSTCSPNIIPGIAWTLEYKPRPNQDFFSFILALPYDTPSCSVNAFMNLDASKDMTGFSFYSSCIVFRYDNLLFQGLSHRFYFAVNQSIFDCRLSKNFTQRFFDHDFGLIIHSNLTQSVGLGRYLKLYPSSDGVATSFGFSKTKDEKVGLLQLVEVDIFRTKFNTSVVLSNNEMSFSGSIEILDYLYQANVITTTSTVTTWELMEFNMIGWFPKNVGTLAPKIEEAVRERMILISHQAVTRQDAADNKRSKAFLKYQNSTREMDLAYERYINASNKYDYAERQLEEAMNNLTKYNRMVANLTGRLREAEIALDTLCGIANCPLECAEVVRSRTVYRDVFVTEKRSCDSLCLDDRRVRVAPFSMRTRKFKYIQCPFYRTECNLQGCVRQIYFRPICKAVTEIVPVFNYEGEVEYVECKVDCSVSVFNTTVIETETYIDNCGQRIPDSICVRANADCQNRRNRALEEIANQEMELVEPLRLRDSSRNTVTILQNQLIGYQLNKDKAKENLDAANVALMTFERLKNQSNDKYLEVVSSLKSELEIHRITTDNSSSDESLFEITNITFSVNTGSLGIISFPITIHFKSPIVSGSEEKTVTLPLNFEAKFEVQKQGIMDRIINDILSDSKRKRRHIDISHTKRATEPNLVPQNIVEHFQEYCVWLTSISDTLNTIQRGLLETEQLAKQLHEGIDRVVTSYNITKGEGISFNYSLLTEFFNISDNVVDSEIDMEQESSLKIMKDFKNLAIDAKSNLEANLITQWQLEMEQSFEGNRTVAGQECFGFSDCLHLTLEVLQDLLLVGPETLRNRLIKTLTDISDEFVSSLADDPSFAALDTVQTVMSVVIEMDENGYWCASLPDIVTHPVSSENVSVGGALTLQCEGNSSIPIRYQWRKDGLLLSNAAKKVLTITNFKITDEGNYTCDISNDVGTRRTTSASVLAYELPEFFLTLVPLITYSGDENGVRFTANATSRPDPGWLWYFKNSTMSDWALIEGEETNELLITEPDKQDEGLYYCVAYNYHGNISSEPVSLTLLRATVRVSSRVVLLQLQGDDQLSLNNSKLADIFVEHLVETQNISQHLISVHVDSSLLVKLQLSSRNVSRVGITKLPLFQIFSFVDEAENGLESYLERVKLLINSQNFSLTVNETAYHYQSGTFTLQVPEYLCPLGQELHSNSLLCVDCLKGHYQTSRENTELVDGSIVRKLVPTCIPCPLNTYQDTFGGAHCIACPEGHITLAVGATSSDQCIRECLTDSVESICESSVCQSEACPAFPDAKCIVDDCGECSARWFLNGKELTKEQCRQCPFAGQVYKSCISNCQSTCTDVKPSCEAAACPNPGCECSNGEVLDTVQKKCVPTKDCETCTLPVNAGPCKGFFPRWYYNYQTGNCELFHYGGCHGNNNQFISKLECVRTCGCGSGRTAVECANNPCSSSTCPGHPTAFCEIETCGECFAKYYDTSLVEVTETCDICKLPSTSGDCQASIPKLFFNSSSGRCESFIYSGCGGNGNQFEHLSDCIKQCGDLCPHGQPPATCLINPCDVSFCAQYSKADCYANHCGGCRAVFYYDNKDVTDLCAVCPNEKPALSCFVNPCKFMSCPEYPQAECRADVCGQCDKVQFYLANGTEVTHRCSICPAKGQIFKLCASTCKRTCDTLGKPLLCGSEDCSPGCDCPSGMILNEMNNECVVESQCPCPMCEPLPENCTNIEGPSETENCSCAKCRDCPATEGQVYQECQPCPRTCSDPQATCTKECISGCGCPSSLVINEVINKCVPLSECPKKGPCSMPVDSGPCLGRIKRYFYNSTSKQCQSFIWGGCQGNENRFSFRHECETLCTNCPPRCTQEYCLINRKGVCSVSSESGVCDLSNCQACYYSYVPLPSPSPSSCPPCCAKNNTATATEETCLREWGKCAQRWYFATYPRIPVRARNQNNFYCWIDDCGT